MKKIKYNGMFANISLSCHSHTLSLKIDTGAFMTCISKNEFRNICPNKKIEDGDEQEMRSASDDDMIGYIHKVSVYFVELQEARFIDICFYDGTRGLLGMETIRKNFEICFYKDNFAISCV